MNNRVLAVYPISDLDIPGASYLAGFDDSAIVAVVIEPGVPVPGAEFHGSRIPDANVRIWRKTAMSGPVVAEAKMDAELPQSGYVVAAWSEDDDAHAQLIESCAIWMKNEGIS